MLFVVVVRPRAMLRVEVDLVAAITRVGKNDRGCPCLRRAHCDMGLKRQRLSGLAACFIIFPESIYGTPAQIGYVFRRDHVVWW